MTNWVEDFERQIDEFIAEVDAEWIAEYGYPMPRVSLWNESFYKGGDNDSGRNGRTSD